MRRALWSLALASCLAGCATVDNYRRDTSASSQVFGSTESAVTGMKPLATLTQERGVNLKIDTRKSPVLAVEESKGGFELIAVNGKHGQEYDIQLTSLCNCLGFRKLILNPISHLLDAKGAVVSSAEIYYVGNLGPIRARLKGKFPADGTYYVLVAANNAQRGEKIRKSWLVVMPMVIPLPMWLQSYPEGEVELVWKKADQ